MNCPHCSADIPVPVDRCVVCGHDVGFPNVRAAQHPDELAALERRVASAESDAAARGCEDILSDFRQIVRGSHAVMCCRLGVLDNVVSSDNKLFSTYYQLVEAEERLPEVNPYDIDRQSGDTALFPYYFKTIRFAALSLDGCGLTGYGPYSVVFRDDAIKERASVFEGNSFFVLKALRVIVGTPVPPGYRAAWGRRHDLAVAKLAEKLSATIQPSNFPTILLQASADREHDEFIEVHIYGPLHRRSIEKVVGQKPKRRQDRDLADNVRRKLQQVNASLEFCQ